MHGFSVIALTQIKNWICFRYDKELSKWLQSGKQSVEIRDVKENVGVELELENNAQPSRKRPRTSTINHQKMGTTSSLFTMF